MSSRNIYLAQTENVSSDKNDASNGGVRGGVKDVELSGALSINVTVFVVMENWWNKTILSYGDHYF
ncbi:hypothetical protein J6590_084418 [Homalodisca vitripennis]|nr:hypothetical protein J6590_084418 [Homalodisca vitripennis]